MPRIMILGCSESGKSTRARRLGKRLGLPVVPLDTPFRRPGWVEPDRFEFRQREIRLHDDAREITAFPASLPRPPA